MSHIYIPVALREVVATNAKYRCEYCQTQSRLVAASLQIDHIIPESKGGESELSNLCLACGPCNQHKASKTMAIDPQTGNRTDLFNPRQQVWSDHFAWDSAGVCIIGLTATGRATVEALDLNGVYAIRSRHLWVQAGWHPPQD